MVSIRTYAPVVLSFFLIICWAYKTVCAARRDSASGLEHSRGLAFGSLVYTGGRYVDHQAAYICRPQAVEPKYTYIWRQKKIHTYFGFASRYYAMKLHVAESKCRGLHGRRAIEFGPRCNHHVRAARKHLGSIKKHIG